jgi:hypothetical protein
LPNHPSFKIPVSSHILSTPSIDEAMPRPDYVNVEVNFDITVDADSKIQLFGETFTAPTNVIVADVTLPVTALYDASGQTGLLEIWEPSDALGDIKCQLANDGGDAEDAPDLSGYYQAAAKALAAGFQAILEGEFDCSGATPYAGNYTAPEYYEQENFGRVALGMMAHYLFGHVDATVAITNDVAFVESMLSTGAGKAVDTTGNVELWDVSGSAANAKLAARLVRAIVDKGKDGAEFVKSSVSAAAVGNLAMIVKQVIGQDSSRANEVDGSQRTLNKHLLLRFYAGDVIYVNINVEQPTVEVVGGSGANPANPPGATLVTAQSYALKITLA